MAEWYYAVSGSREGPVSAEQISELSRAGTIRGDSLVWREGMAEWIRFDQSEFGSEDTAKCAVTGEIHPTEKMLPYGDQWVLPQHKEQFIQGLKEGPQAGGGNFSLEWNDYEFIDPTKREKIAKGGIVFVVSAFVLWVTGCAVYGGYLGATDQMEAFDEEMVSILGILILLPVFLVGNILYLLWVYRVVKNAHVIARRELDQTPGWAVGFHFIPIAVLFKPYVAIKQVWNVSQGLDLKTGSTLLGWWWACWLIYSILGNMIPLFGVPVGGVACVLAWIFISRISQWQRELAYGG